ncbi:hypothetical protein C8R44DRAFT_865605 [Mycena epipterygia]|nr:hypothetical protein C8R44DRAFT_865605 [Mycena epipterygia]
MLREMQFSLVALATLTTGISSAPVNPLFNRAGTSNINTCAAALAPSFPTACDPAVAQAGANTHSTLHTLVPPQRAPPPS